MVLLYGVCMWHGEVYMQCGVEVMCLWSDEAYLVWRCACVYVVWWYEGVYMCGGVCL